MTNRNTLCKFRGMLVIMECEIHDKDENYEGRCPNCYNTKFIKDGKWTMCNECGFSALIKENND